MSINKHNLPSGWRWVKIGDIAEVSTGGTPDTNHPEYYGGDIRWLKSGDIQRTYIEEVPNRISQLGLDNSNARIHPAGSVMLAMSGQGKTRGTSAILRIPSTCSQSVAAILPTEHAIPEIIHYALVNRYEDTRRITGDNERTGLNLKLIREITILLPPLDEQRRIASRLNEQLAAVESARKAAEEQLQAAYQLPSAYLSSIFNNGKSQEWKRRKLGDLCEISARQVDPKIPKYGALPHVNGENIESGTCQLLYLNTAAEEGMKSGKYLFDAGDVLYSKLRPYLRKVIVADFRGVCSADMYPIKVNQELLDSHFLSWVLVSDEFTRYADEESRRARMPKLNRDQLFGYEAALPSLDKQKEIAAFMKDKIEQTKQIVTRLESQLAEIESLPASLLREAFAGEPMENKQ